MRTKGFIFILLGFTAVVGAGTPGYLPRVGPVALRFDSAVAATPVALLSTPPVITSAIGETNMSPEVVVDIPVEFPTNAAPPAPPLMHDVPVALPESLTEATTNSNQTLIGPLMDASGLITPQMFLRFFLPSVGGVSHEAIVLPQTDFTPARPPQASSTATYKQIKQ